jgi:FkbM family methyltransferase
MPSLRSAYHLVVRTLRGEPRVTPGRFDPASLPALLEKADPVILDIGAYDGTHSAAFATLFPAGRVFSFEPLPRAVAMFRRAVRSNRVILFPVAVSKVDGVADFHVSAATPESGYPDGGFASSSLHAPKEHVKAHPAISFSETIQVRTVRLDTWRREQGIDRVDFIWADTQGAEADLIEGGAETLRHTRYFYTEYYDCEMYEGQKPLRDLLKMLPDFAVVARYGSDVLLRNVRLDRRRVAAQGRRGDRPGPRN